METNQIEPVLVGILYCLIDTTIVGAIDFRGYASRSGMAKNHEALTVARAIVVEGGV